MKDLFKYAVINDSVTILGWHDDFDVLKRIEIPAEIEGKPVTTIGKAAFKNIISLRDVVIPDSVTSIEEKAFYNSSLETIKLGQNLISIGEFAFSGCHMLTSVKIPDSVTTIGNYAFHFCYTLVHAKLGNSVKSIGDFAFWSCDKLSKMIFPKSVEHIGNDAFYNCRLISEFIFEGDKPHICDDAFSCVNIYSKAYFYSDTTGWSDGEKIDTITMIKIDRKTT